MRLEIDWTRCEGAGLCAELVPGRIGRDDWGYPLLPSGVIAADDLASVRRAVASCPTLALRIEQAR